MRRTGEVREPDQRHIMDNSQRFNFLDISQSVGNYSRTLFVREYIAESPRPINSVKLYNMAGDEESVARMFRIVFAGGASARFHRPHPLDSSRDHEASTQWGLGLSPRAQAAIRSARMLTDEINLFVCTPRNDLLSEKSSDEVYCLAEPGRQYALYFPDGGAVRLDLSVTQGEFTLRWLDINESQWTEEAFVQGGGPVEVATPGEGHWAAVIQASE